MKTNNLNKIKHSGFKVPKDYFESLEDHLLSHISLNDKLNFNNHSGFKVPEDYFNSLENNIIDKVSLESKGRVISILNRKTVITVSGIAAALALFFGLSDFENEPTFNNLQTETVENYIIEDFNSYEIASLLSEDQLDDEIFVESNIENDNIETYLLDNLDIEDLLIE